MTWCALISLCYLCALLFIAQYHEMWRDEVRALTIAISSTSFADLVHNLKNEGHPLIWYVLLRSAYLIFPTPLVLPAVSIAVAIIAGWIFLRYAPFHPALKCLWLLGYYPLYEYSISCRNYGIGMLLLFWFLANFPKRFDRPLVSGVVLALLANTSAFAWILSVSLLASLFVELLIVPEERVRLKRHLPGGALAVFGVLLGVLQMWPSGDTIVSDVSKKHLSGISFELPAALLSQGAVFDAGVGAEHGWIITVVVLSLYLLLIRTPSRIVLIASSVLGMELFHRLIYYSLALRHQGFLSLTFIAAIWIDAVSKPEVLRGSAFFNRVEPLRRVAMIFGLTLLLLGQARAGIKAALREVKEQMSSAPELAAFVHNDPRLQSAIIMAEPDSVADTLPYYLENRIYFPRERKFKRTASFTSAAQPKFNLSEMLGYASEVSAEQHSDILLLLPPNPENKTLIRPYGRTFDMNRQGVEDLHNKTRLLATFDKSEGDENYSAWLLESQSK